MTKQVISFEVGGLTLRGNLYVAENPKKLAVLFVHGWTGLPNESAAEVMAQNGYTCLTFNLSGHGNSDGQLENQSRQKSFQEVLAAYDFFNTQLPAGAKIATVGNSYGGYLATLLTTERPIDYLQLRVPANYPDEGYNQPQIGQGGDDPLVMKWRRQELDSAATKSLRALCNYQGPVQIIEAELDERVPHQTVQNYVDAVNNKTKLDYHLMKGWPHSLGLDAERNRQYQEILLNWTEEVLKQL